MTLTEQVFAQAVLLTGELDDRQRDLLSLLCLAATSSLSTRLREGLTPEDCRADFVAAASLYALASLAEADEMAQMESFTAGDVTIRRGKSNAAAQCLRYQAEMIISPYMKDRFAFMGV